MSLRVDDVVKFGGRPYRVSKVNECRAVLVPTEKRRKTYMPATGRDAGRLITYESVNPSLNVSTEAELPVIGRWTEEGVVAAETNRGAR